MKFLTLLIILFFSIIAGLILLTITSLIPQSIIKHNFIQSAEVLIRQGQYPSIGFPFRKIVLDNFSDAFQLNIAYSINEKQPLKSAISTIWYAKTENPYNQIENLSLYIKGRNNAISPIPYERYWHGYLIFLRPLMILFPYGSIRVILTIILFLLAFSCGYLFWKRKEKGSAIAIIIGLLYVDFLFVSQSMHFSTPFIIGLSILLFLLKKNPKENKLSLLFLLTGILTAFFDVLTTPIITFGLLWFGVLVLYEAPRIYTHGIRKDGNDEILPKQKHSSMNLHQRSSAKEDENLKTIKHIINAFWWGIGYGVMWVSKWILAEITYMPGAFNNALNEVFIRTTHSPDREFSRIETIKRNALQLIGYDKSNKIFLLILFIIIVLLIILLFIFRRISFKHISLKIIFLYGTLAIIPYMWYFIAANHSYMHVWFTYRDQLLTVIGAVMILSEIFQKKLSRFK